MNNKVLVRVYIPNLNQEYDCFIPIGKTVGTVKKVILDTIGSLNEFEFLNKIRIYNSDNSRLYNDSDLISELDIKNGTKLLLI